MSLLGWPFLVGMTMVAIATPLGVALLWGRWPRRAAWPARLLGLLLVMAVGAGYSATLANRAFGFYSTVSDLLASSALTYRPPPSFQTARQGSADAVQVEEPNWFLNGRASAQNGRGSMLRVLLAGRRSGLSRHGFVYLPATWFLDTGVSLPVVEMLHGYPGSPGNFQVQLGIQGILDQEIAARRLPPTVAVFPNTYQQGRASECVDAVNGERNETYLAVDVPNDVQATFGTIRGRSLGLLGYSEGGFCAVNLGLHHPDRVTAAVSLAGYFTAGTDTGTKVLYAGVRGALLRNSPLWWVRYRQPTAPALLLVSGGDDRASLSQDRALARAARRYAPKLTVISALLPNGAHNFATFDRALPAALDFLGEYLPSPSAPLLRLPLDPQVQAPVAPGPNRAPSYGPRPPSSTPRISRRPQPAASNPSPPP